MALIDCPECGKQISTNAGQCVHCGCKFTYCPECQTVAVGTVGQCANCGYKFSGNITPAVREEIDGELSETANFDLFKAWQRSMPNDKKILTGFKYVNIILGAATVVLMITGVVLIANWNKISDPLEKLSGVKELRSGLRVLVALACILEIITFLFEYTKQSFVKIRCGNWIRRQKFDCVAYINETIKNRGRDYVKSSEYDDMELFNESAYISENPSAKTLIYIGGVLRAVCAIVLMICVGEFAVQNLDEYVRALLYSSEFDFKYAALIAAAVVCVIYFVTAVLSSAAYLKKFEAWKEQYLTAYKEYEEV